MSSPPPNLNQIIKQSIPPLSPKSYKGSSGRIGILGGSERYTGAPYYAAMASLQMGCDLVFVFCAEEACTPLKCYSPELMVASVYSWKEFEKGVRLADEEGGERERTRLVENMVEEVTSLFPRLHTLIVGPGLGRHPLVMQATAQIISEAKKINLPLVLDADALFLLSEYRNVLQGYPKHHVVLTPNVVEYKRLMDVDEDGNKVVMDDVIIVQKGFHDVISSSSQTNTMVCKETGGMKRSGGIGDVLAGTIGAMVAWNKILHKNPSESNGEVLLSACYLACCVVKRATYKAFQRRKRAMTAPDILEDIGGVVDDMTQLLDDEEQNNGSRL